MKRGFDMGYHNSRSGAARLTVDLSEDRSGRLLRNGIELGQLRSRLRSKSPVARLQMAMKTFVFENIDRRFSGWYTTVVPSGLLPVDR